MSSARKRLTRGVAALVAWLGAGAASAQPTIVVEAARAGGRASTDGDGAPLPCPGLESIRSALRSLRPDLDQPTAQTVRVSLEAETILLTLGDGGPGSMRVLPATGDCAARADAVALVIAAWSGGLPAQPTLAPLSSATAIAPAPVARRRHVLEVDASAFQSLVWGHAPGAWLGAAVFPRAGWLGVRAFVAWQGAEDRAVAGGHNLLYRGLGGAAAALNMKWRAWFGSIDLGLAMTYTHARGEGYSSNADASVLNLGGLADVRTGLDWGWGRVWIDARVLRLVHDEDLSITGEGALPQTTSLPIWDGQLGLGLGVRFE